MFCISLISVAKVRQNMAQVLDTFRTSVDTKWTAEALWESVMWYDR
ncbi:hypothetical protein SAMN05880573_104250 [Chryseobacterium sp. RU33C]|nr:hypothetical protein SAMN05880573_104250 [Chryseobacterium sp. RU33C]